MTDLVIPRPGESINEVIVSKWFVPNGSWVQRDQEVGEIESDKATLPLIAPVSGKIEVLIEAGQNANVGAIACRIDELAKNDNVINETALSNDPSPKMDEQRNTSNAKSAEAPKSASVRSGESDNKLKMSPLARKLMNEKNLSVDDVIHGLRRISKDDVEAVIANNMSAQSTLISQQTSRTEGREPMSQLRKKLSARLVAVRNQTAMLTTFNEIDMSALMALRAKYQKSFTEKHGLKLGFMSFFTKAASVALLKFPRINSQLDGDIIISPNYVDMAIAVQTDKGLMVPVVRNTDSLSVSDIEKSIATLAAKARAARLSIDEMTGGTFTITNGGVFGSLLSTPIINPPQSAILGMHNITERPVAINGKVEVRPVMFVALSYDHRIIDGRDSVSFLVKVKELIEKPENLLFQGKDAGEVLLGL